MSLSYDIEHRHRGHSHRSRSQSPHSGRHSPSPVPALAAELVPTSVTINYDSSPGLNAQELSAALSKEHHRDNRETRNNRRDDWENQDNWEYSEQGTMISRILISKVYINPCLCCECCFDLPQWCIYIGVAEIVLAITALGIPIAIWSTDFLPYVFSWSKDIEANADSDKLLWIQTLIFAYQILMCIISAIFFICGFTLVVSVLKTSPSGCIFHCAMMPLQIILIAFTGFILYVSIVLILEEFAQYVSGNANTTQYGVDLKRSQKRRDSLQTYNVAWSVLSIFCCLHFALCTYMAAIDVRKARHRQDNLLQKLGWQHRQTINPYYDDDDRGMNSYTLPYHTSSRSLRHHRESRSSRH